jgi:hypothetical protein
MQTIKFITKPLAKKILNPFMVKLDYYPNGNLVFHGKGPDTGPFKMGSV